MRRSVLVYLLAAGAFCGLSATASAGVRVLVASKTYDIAGATGSALLDAMDRKGPRHGFTTRAIAQTSYTVDWTFDLAGSAQGCRVQRANGTLNLTYTFPHVSSVLTSSVRRRWITFFAGVQAHEQNHARLARQMMSVAEKSVSGLSVPGDSRCWKTRREARQRVQAVYNEYEAKQVAFDEREHRDGGRVEKLIDALLRKR